MMESRLRQVITVLQATKMKGLGGVDLKSKSRASGKRIE